jgi:hypothetical protein
MATHQLKRSAGKYDIKISTPETKVMEMYGRNIQRVKRETDRKVTEQVSDFIYLQNRISKLKKKTDTKLQTYSTTK